MLTKCGISAGYIHFLKWLFPVIIAVVCVRFLTLISNIKCLLGGEVVKKSTCQCRRYNRCGFDPWIRKIPWSRKWQHAPVLLPGKIPWTEEPGGLWSMGWKGVGHDWAAEHPCMHIRYRKVLSFRKSCKTTVTHENKNLICCVNIWREGNGNTCLGLISVFLCIYINQFILKSPWHTWSSVDLRFICTWVPVWINHFPTEYCLNYKLWDNNTYLYFFLMRVY